MRVQETAVGGISSRANFLNWRAYVITAIRMPRECKRPQRRDRGKWRRNPENWQRQIKLVPNRLDGECPASLIGHGGQVPIFAFASFRPARVTLLSVVGIAARAEAATSIGRIGSGCLAFRRAMMRSRHLRLCPGSLVRTGRTATRADFLSGDHIVRRAPPSRCCRTWCHRSTWRGARRQVYGPR